MNPHPEHHGPVDPDDFSLRELLAMDLQRHGKTGLRAGLGEYWRNIGFRFVATLRVCKALRSRRALYPVFLVASFFLVRMSRRYGIAIPIRARIGPGFYIGHFGTIVVHHDAVLGANCNISQGVTIGQTNRGARMGVPVIGNGVYLGPGAKIIGRVAVGDGSAVGANAVVTRDVPPRCVAVGVPAKIIEGEGSLGYIQTPCEILRKPAAG